MPTYGHDGDCDGDALMMVIAMVMVLAMVVVMVMMMLQQMGMMSKTFTHVVVLVHVPSPVVGHAVLDDDGSNCCKHITLPHSPNLELCLSVAHSPGMFLIARKCGSHGWISCKS